MGFFSWITSDTKKSIANNCSRKKTFTVHMITENGMVFTEDDYAGYGVFGGKDIYELIGEMNKIKTTGEMRSVVLDMLYETHITNGVKSYKQGTNSNKGADFFNWESPLASEGGKTPNQLVKEGWKQVYPNGYGDWNIAAKNGIKLPKLVSKLPNREQWKQVWDSLPYPESCSDQGYFY